MDSLFMFIKTLFLSCLTITMAAGIGVLVSLNVFIVHCPYLEKYIIRSIALALFAMKIKCHSQLLRLYVSPQSLIYSIVDQNHIQEKILSLWKMPKIPPNNSYYSKAIYFHVSNLTSHLLFLAVYHINKITINKKDIKISQYTHNSFT